MKCIRATRFLICLGLACLLLHGRPAAAQPMAGIDVEKAMAQMLADAKALAGSDLPDPKLLGEGWKRPWELPPAVSGAIASEEAYWTKAIENMGFASVSEQHARAMLDSIVPQMVASGAGEGITERDAVIFLLSRIRGTDAAAATKIHDAWVSAAAALALAPDRDHEKPLDPQAHERQATRAIMDMVGAPYRAMSVNQLKEAFIKEATRISKRTEMSYFRSNNWDGLAQARSEKEIVEKGLWLGVVKVNMMLADDQRTGELLDLQKTDAPALESKLATAVRVVVNRTMQMRHQKLEREIKQATTMGDEDKVKGLRETMARETAAAAELAVTVAPKDFGDNSYVVRIGGVSPETAGLKVGLYTGWIRNGNAMVEITMGGNFPEKEMTTEMDHFLSEMYAKIQDYQSAPARAQ